MNKNTYFEYNGVEKKEANMIPYCPNNSNFTFRNICCTPQTPPCNHTHFVPNCRPNFGEFCGGNLAPFLLGVIIGSNLLNYPNHKEFY